MSSPKNLLDDYINNEVIPHAEEFDRERVIQRSDSEMVLKYGLLSEIFNNNSNASLKMLARSLVRISPHCGNIRNLFLVNYGMVGKLLEQCSDVNSVFLNEFNLLKTGKTLGALAITELSGGSNPKSFISRIERVEGNLLLSGQKTWITLGCVADFYIVQAWLDSEARLIYVPKDAPGVSRAQIENISGSRGSGLGIIKFDRVPINEEYIFPRVLSGYPNTSCLEFTMRSGRLLAGASGLGMGLGALNMTTKVLREKKNLKGSIFLQGDWQARISKLYLQSIALKGILTDVIGNYNECVASGADKFTPLKILGTQFGIDASKMLLEATGANSYKVDSVENRIWRESMAGEFIEGGNAVLINKCSLDWLKISISDEIYDPY